METNNRAESSSSDVHLYDGACLELQKFMQAAAQNAISSDAANSSTSPTTRPRYLLTKSG